MSSLYLIGTAQTFFLSLLILTKKQKRLSDLFLFLFILLMGLRLLFIYFRVVGFYEMVPKLIISEFFFWPLFGPVLFLYVLLITSENEKFKAQYLIHFLPLLIVLISFSGYIFSRHQGDFDDYKSDHFLFIIGKELWLFTTHVYYIFCLIKLHLYRKSIKNYFSYKKNINLNWLIVLTYGFGIFLFYSLTYILARDRFNFDIPIFGNHFAWLIMVLYIFTVSFFGYRQKGVFTSAATSEIDIKSEENKVRHRLGSYTNSKIAEPEIRELLDGLTSLMENEKPYLDCELDLRMVSDKLETTTHKLSQAINSTLQKNFFEFVNEYRVMEAKRCLTSTEYDKEKIMTIAWDCGFNSKSTFYSVFRKYTSKTPVEYRNDYLGN